MTEEASSFALKIQQLPNDVDRVLVLGELLGLKNGNGCFSTGDVSKLFDELRVPKPSNISARLGDLRAATLVIRTDQGWTLTPVGRVEAAAIVGAIDPERIASEVAESPGAEVAHERHSVISPLFAPQKWSEPIARLAEKYPFETNVFCMTRYPEDSDDIPDPVKGAIDAIRDALASHGLTLHLALERQLDDDLLGNVAAYMWACQYGIGLIEERTEPLNHNVLIELGAMVMTGRRCAFLRDEKTAPKMPTDFVGQIYKSVDFDDIEEVKRTIHAWVAMDLGLGMCKECS